MSSMLKKYKENVKKNKLEFDIEMYKNIYGSFGIAYYRCYSLMHSEKENLTYKTFLRKLWKRMKEDKVTLPFIDDKEYVKKMCKVYHIDDTDFPYGHIALVKGENNSLFAPCYMTSETNEEGEKKYKVQILPLREDGSVGRTLMFGKPYVIFEDKGSTEKC